MVWPRNTRTGNGGNHLAKNYLAQQEQQGMGVYDVGEEHEPNLDDFVDQDQEQFEDQTLMSIPS